MAQRYLFFNSITGDRRRYQAQDFAEYFGSILSTGLLHTDTEEPGLVVSVEQGTLNTVVSDGKAIMRGHLYENTTPVTLEHRIPEPDADRIDRVVLRLDLRQSERNILLHVIEGDASNPPELQRDNSIYEISLAQIRVRANTSSIDPQDVIDERLDDNLCGLVRLMFPFPSEQFVTHLEFDEHLADYTNPHRVKSEHINLIDDDSLTEGDLITKYPIGTTSMLITPSTISNWSIASSGYLTVITHKQDDSFGIQYAMRYHISPAADTYIVYRKSSLQSGATSWSPWKRMGTVTGTYTGTGVDPGVSSQDIDIGFTPTTVIVNGIGSGMEDYGFAINGTPDYAGDNIKVEIIPNGFRVHSNNTSPVVNLNQQNQSPYRYAAFV